MNFPGGEFCPEEIIILRGLNGRISQGARFLSWIAESQRAVESWIWHETPHYTAWCGIHTALCMCVCDEGWWQRAVIPGGNSFGTHNCQRAVWVCSLTSFQLKKLLETIIMWRFTIISATANCFWAACTLKLLFFCGANSKHLWPCARKRGGKELSDGEYGTQVRFPDEGITVGHLLSISTLPVGLCRR